MGGERLRQLHRVAYLRRVHVPAAGYDKTQFGRRMALILVKYLGRRSLTLGYAITFADLLLAPFTPSNTARSGGTIYPIIANLPPLYGSKPNDPSARKIGSYLMWVAITAACITSSMFLSALAPNLLALALVKSIVGINISPGTIHRLPATGYPADSDHAAAGLVFCPPEVKSITKCRCGPRVNWKNWANCRAMKFCCWYSSASR